MEQLTEQTPKKNPVIKAAVLIISLAILSVAGYFIVIRNPATYSPLTDENKTATTPIANLKNLPLRTTSDRIERLPFVVKDGWKEFSLTVDEVMWEYMEGKYMQVWAYNGQIPGPEIRVTEGDKVRVIVKNNLKVQTSIHWHGTHIDNKADGIPGLSSDPIKPGETYAYEFTATPAGTRFYHTHGSSHMDVATQLDMGLSGPLIIEQKNPKKYDREYVYMLDEWDIAPDGSNRALLMPNNHSTHSDPNIFTINGRSFPDTDTLWVKKGEKILIRLINSGTNAIHPMHTHGHSYKVVAMDGFSVPEGTEQERDNLVLNPGERYDIELIANNPGRWLFHCHQVHHASAGMIVPFFYANPTD